MKRFNCAVMLLCVFMVNGHANTTLRDPTAPLDYTGSTTQKVTSDKKPLHIQGLFISKSKRVALIDDVFYAVGDLTRQGPLVAIFKDRVVVKKGKIMRVIFMMNDKVRRD